MPLIQPTYLALAEGQRLILASASPRRQEILLSLGLTIEIRPSSIDEAQKELEAPVDYVCRLAQAKAADIASQNTEGVVVGADTIVVAQGQILGKPGNLAVPENRISAQNMLTMLADSWHQVYTGLAVINIANSKQAVDYCCTEVKFRALTSAEIAWYINTQEPADKAGSYAIQGYGSLFIEEIRGNYPNVVGLPVPLLTKLLLAVAAPLVYL